MGAHNRLVYMRICKFAGFWGFLSFSLLLVASLCPFVRACVLLANLASPKKGRERERDRDSERVKSEISQEKKLKPGRESVCKIRRA
jgi:hypothetical protein